MMLLEDMRPVVTVLGVDITDGCEIDHMTHKILLPTNLPGGLDVLVNGEYLMTTPIPLADRQAEMDKAIRKAPKLQPLCVAIRAGLLMQGAELA